MKADETNTILIFKDFNFKIMVINELMYHQTILKPKFNVYHFIKKYQQRKINIEEERYRIIPEVKVYFEKLQLQATDLERITTLCQDPGDEIYGCLCPYPFYEVDWATFCIQSADDVHLLPNLKSMELMYETNTAVVAAFREKNIKVYLD